MKKPEYIKAVSATYKKLRYSQQQKFPEAVWDFHVDTDSLMPHEYAGFGGVLKRSPDNQWQAKCYSATEYSAPASDRLKAIQNCIDQAVVLFEQHNREQQQEEARRNARRDLQTELSRLFSDNKEIHLSCNDWRIEDPLVFSIEIHSLTEMDVRRMAEVLIPQTPGFTLAPR